jgi:hypothetical protein
MKVYRLQMAVQDLIYTKPIRPIVFKDFSIGRFTYSAIRFKWLAKVVQRATGCRHRYWKEAEKEMTEHKLELDLELKEVGE